MNTKTSNAGKAATAIVMLLLLSDVVHGEEIGVSADIVSARNHDVEIKHEAEPVASAQDPVGDSWMSAVFFSIHVHFAADVPLEYGVYAFQAAAAVDIDPYDLVALLVTEHTGEESNFSIYTSVGRHARPRYPEDEVGKGGEIGLYQQKPNWVGRANKYYGTSWKSDDLYDPWINTKVAAYQVMHAIEKHSRACTSSSLHDWTAHWKCSLDSRDALTGQCRYAQRKYHKVRTSMTSVLPVDTKEVGKEYNAAVRRKLDKDQRNNKHFLRYKIKRICVEQGIEVPSNLKELTIDQLQAKLDFLESMDLSAQ